MEDGTTDLSITFSVSRSTSTSSFTCSMLFSCSSAFIRRFMRSKSSVRLTPVPDVPGPPGTAFSPFSQTPSMKHSCLSTRFSVIVRKSSKSSTGGGQPMLSRWARGGATFGANFF
uniref:Uncharacterized protein n=1 Tax=Anopheles culicifacies TaxID=139723 RepID=A0A182MGM4_9DIPT